MNKTLRDCSIDFLRFLAITLMIFAHANMLLQVSGSPINVFFETLGNTICFALFLFCFAASKYYSKNYSKKDLLKRIGSLYFVYVIIVSIFLIENGILDVIELLQYFIFYKMPSYAEFIAAFIIYEILFFFFRNWIDKLTTNLITIVLSGFIFFLIGNMLSYYEFGFVKPFTALFFGYNGYFSFPIFQYTIFILGGFYYAKKQSKQIINNKSFIFIMIISGVIFFLSYIASLNIGETMKRWSPSFDFIMSNIFLISLFVSLYGFLKETLNRKVISKIFQVISKYAIHLLYIHIFVLYLLRWIDATGFPLLAFVATLVILSIPFILENNAIKAIYIGPSRKNAS